MGGCWEYLKDFLEMEVAAALLNENPFNWPLPYYSYFDFCGVFYVGVLKLLTMLF